MSALSEALTDPIFAGYTPTLQEVKLVAQNAPAIAHALIAAHQAFRHNSEQLASIDDTLGRGPGLTENTPYEEVRDFFHFMDNYIHALDLKAEALAGRLGIASGPDDLAIRRNVSVAPSEAEAQERSQRAREAVSKVLTGDPRVRGQPSWRLDTPKSGSGFSVHPDEFIAGTPAQVAEQIIVQCRACGAGHIVAILGRAVDEHRIQAVALFGEQVIPILRRAEIA